MKALLLEAADGPDALRLADVDDPAPQDGMVRIEVHAAGVGFVDMLVSHGRYQIKPTEAAKSFARTTSRWAGPARY